MKKKVIFGAGETGYVALRHYGVENVAAFADNYKKGKYCGLPIIGLEELAKIQDEYIIVIASSLYSSEITKTFENAGIRQFEIYKKRESNKKTDKSKIASYKGIHRRKRCFIIGTGPSLTMEDLNTLHMHREICIGTNKIFLAFDKTDWRPNYYFISDWVQSSQYAEEIGKLKISNKFVSNLSVDFWDSPYSTGSICFNLYQSFYETEMPPFSFDASEKIVQGMTVSYESLQLAVYMGFSEIYYLGVDFDYSRKMITGENHFTNNYFKKGEVYTPFKGEKQLLAYKKAELISRDNGFRIYNATRGGKLEVFDRVDFDSLFTNE